MIRDSIIASLTPVFQDVLDAPDLHLTPTTSAGDVSGWDSVAHITLVVAIEQRFGIRFNTAEIEEMRNVGDLARLIAQKVGREQCMHAPDGVVGQREVHAALADAIDQVPASLAVVQDLDFVANGQVCVRDVVFEQGDRPGKIVLVAVEAR